MATNIDVILGELAAVRTEFITAVDTIMTVTERIEDLAPGLPLEAAAEISASAAEIFESCGFQDLTGQRLAKIEKILTEVQARGGNAGANSTKNDEWNVEAVSTGDTLLNGPQTSDRALPQDAIDSLFGSSS